MGGDRSCFPPCFAITGAVSSDLAALPHFSGNQCGCRVGKPEVQTEASGRVFCCGRFLSELLFPANLGKMCPFPSVRIVSLLSKFRLGFHEVHILPDINQKPRPEQ